MVKIRVRVYDRSDKLIYVRDAEFAQNQLSWKNGGIPILGSIPIIGEGFAPVIQRFPCNYDECYDEGKQMTAMYHQYGDIMEQIPRRKQQICKVCKHMRAAHVKDTECSVKSCSCEGFIPMEETTDSQGVDYQKAFQTEELAWARFDANVKAPVSLTQFIQIALTLIAIIVLVGVLYSLNNLKAVSDSFSGTCSIAKQQFNYSIAENHNSTIAFKQCIALLGGRASPSG